MKNRPNSELREKLEKFIESDPEDEGLQTFWPEGARAMFDLLWPVVEAAKEVSDGVSLELRAKALGAMYDQLAKLERAL